MNLDFLRAEIERMRRQISRQQKDIHDLQRSGISGVGGIVVGADASDG
jgi:hypothetical protein